MSRSRRCPIPCRHDQPHRGRLPRCRGRRHGDGVHGRAGRPRPRRPGGARRPSARRRRALAGGVPVRPAAPVLELLRRRVDAARRWSGAGPRARGRPARAGRPAGDPGLLRERAGRPAARVGAGRVLPRLVVPGRPHRRLAGVGPDVLRAGALPGGRRAIPRSRHPGRAAAEVRRRRRRPGGPGQRPRAPPGGAEPVRRRRLRQDRHRCLRLAAGARRGPGRDLLGAPPRSVDAQPGADPAEPGHLPGHGRLDAGVRWFRCVPGRPVPSPRGRRDHAAHRPHGHAHDGEVAHPRPPGSSTCSGASRTSSGSVTSPRSPAAASSCRMARSRSPTTRWS